MFAVTVEFKIKPEHAEDFRQAVRTQAKNSLEREPDCHHFDVCLDPKDASLVFLYELYTDAASFDAHVETDHFHNFSATITDWLVDKSIRTWNLEEK